MSRPWVVLAYHAVGDVAPEHDPDRLVQAPDKLEWQLGRLAARGYEFVTASVFARRLRAGDPLEGVCAVTFDDGTIDNLTTLPPILERLGGIPATIFACPGLLGRDDPYIAPESGLRLMDADELRELAGLGFEVGAHTNEHSDLAAARGEDAYTEMTSCKGALEDLLGKPVETFAYPFCRYSAACPAAAERAGYLAAFTCSGRGGRLPFELRREMMDSRDGRLTWALKSRRRYHETLDLAPVRAALAARDRLKGRTHGGADDSLDT
jgi:peptidoglycan/xylan/chitin deacetylase (PgdA/CDA1 family)